MPETKKAPEPADILADGAGSGAVHKHDFTTEQVERARRAINDEGNWYRRHRDWWRERILAPCLADARAGRRFSVREKMERERWTPFYNELREPMHLSNDWSGIWARRILREHPEVRRFMVIRESPLDVVLEDA